MHDVAQRGIATPRDPAGLYQLGSALSSLSISSDGAGFENMYPCAYSHPISRSIASCASVSTPSATPMLLASAGR
jgi:hypothetical protein